MAKAAFATFEQRAEVSKFIRDFVLKTFDTSIDPDADGSLKRNTAFIKKLKNISLESLDSLSKEFKLVKCTKFIDEIVKTLASNTLDSIENILSVSNMIIILNSRYPEVFPLYRKQLVENIDALIKEKDIEQINNSILLYFITSINFLHSLDDSCFAIFKKVAHWNECLDEISDSLGLTIFIASHFLQKNSSGSVHALFLALICSFFDFHIRILKKRKSSLYSALEKAKNYYVLKGDIEAGRVSYLSEFNQKTLVLERNLRDLAQCIGKIVPEFKEHDNVEITERVITFHDPSFKKFECFASLEEQEFYVNLPPFSNEASNELLDLSEDTSIKEFNPDQDGDGSNFFAGLENAGSVEDVNGFAISSVRNDNLDIDLISSSFTSITRKRPDLIKFACRCVAIISKANPELATSIVRNLEGQFRFLVRLPVSFAWTRTRIALCIGELCKFRILNEGQAFSCLKRSLSNPTNSNILLASTLLESCGKFLYGLQSSQKRIELIIEMMEKLKARVVFDWNIISAINSAVNSIRANSFSKVIAPVDYRVEFILHLVKSCVDQHYIDSKLSMFPWSDDLAKKELLMRFAQCWHFDFSFLTRIPSAVKNVSKIDEKWSVSFVDCVLDCFSQSLAGKFLNKQKAFSLFSLIIQLYKHSLIEPTTFYSTLDLVFNNFIYASRGQNFKNCIVYSALFLHLYAVCPEFSREHWSLLLFSELEATFLYSSQFPTELCANYCELSAIFGKDPSLLLRHRPVENNSGDLSFTSTVPENFDKAFEKLVASSVDERKLEHKKSPGASSDLMKINDIATNHKSFIYKRRNKLKVMPVD